MLQLLEEINRFAQLVGIEVMDVATAEEQSAGGHMTTCAVKVFDDADKLAADAKAMDYHLEKVLADLQDACDGYRLRP